MSAVRILKSVKGGKHPPTTTLPITYTWRASGQSPVTHAGLNRLTDTVTFTWPSGVTGLQAITITTANADGMLTGLSAITLSPLFSEVSAMLTGVDNNFLSKLS